MEPIKRHTERVGKVPREVATDRGMASETNDLALQTLGVEHRSLPKTGKKDAAEQAREATSWFRRLQRFRAGGEGSHQLAQTALWVAAQPPAWLRTGQYVDWLGRHYPQLDQVRSPADRHGGVTPQELPT